MDLLDDARCGDPIARSGWPFLRGGYGGEGRQDEADSRESGPSRIEASFVSTFRPRIFAFGRLERLPRNAPALRSVSLHLDHRWCRPLRHDHDLVILACSAVGVYGIVLGGWASGSTYPLLGGLRSSAQVISYEVAMGLSIVAVFMTAGTMSTSGIVLLRPVGARSRGDLRLAPHGPGLVPTILLIQASSSSSSPASVRPTGHRLTCPRRKASWWPGRSATVTSWTCTGASQVGNAPAKCSIRMAMKRSKRAEDRAVEHDRAVLGVVLADVGEVEALGRDVVELDGAQLPLAADAVGDVEVDLRAVERAVARLELVRQARASSSAALSAASARSQSASSPMRFSGRVASLRRVLEPERVVDAGRAAATKRFDLVGDLILGAVDVRVVLRELAHAGEAAERARRLVAVQHVLGVQAQRQLAVAVLLECRRTGGATGSSSA